MRKKRDRKFEDWLCEKQGIFPKTALRYVIEGLIPYTDANFKLAFRPHAFFNELEKIQTTGYRRETIRKAYYEAKRKNLFQVDVDGRVVLSPEAEKRIKPFIPKQLKGSCIMVIFDIPELEKRKREWFRLLLRELKFEQIQKSVWTSEFECYEVLTAAILEQRLEKYVRVFEARAVES